MPMMRIEYIRERQKKIQRAAKEAMKSGRK
jgi:hypothetical protein